MTTIWAEAFWKAQPDDEKPAPRVVGARRRLIPLVVPSAVFASLTIVIGLAGGPMFAFAMRAATQLLDRQPYIEAVLKVGGGSS